MDAHPSRDGYIYIYTPSFIHMLEDNASHWLKTKIPVVGYGWLVESSCLMAKWVTHSSCCLNPDAIAVQDIIAILGMDELSEEDKLTVARARKARLGHKVVPYS